MRSSNLKLGGIAALVLAALAAAFTLVWASGSAAGPAAQQAAAEAGPSMSRAVAPPAQPAEALAPATAAAPTQQRSFVSAGSGNDANPCTRTAPCRNFAKAITTTLDNGEIIVLDSGGYGQVLIDRPVSIISPPGVYAGITAFSGIAVHVNLTGAGTVRLSGLTLNGLGGDWGVLVDKADQVFVDRLTISGFVQPAIDVTAGNIDVFIKDTLAMRNYVGIRFRPGAGNLTAAVDRVRLERNDFGIEAVASSQVSVRDSVVVRHQATAIAAYFGAQLNVEDCVVTHNGNGVGGSPTVRVSETMIANNSTGIFGGPTSFGNNRLGGNTANGTWGATIPES